MSSELNQYIIFLTETLGVQSILSSDAKNTSTNVTEIVRYLIAVEDLNNYEAPEVELLTKMIAALKLSPNDFKICDMSESGKFKSEVSVSLCDQPTGSNQTYSARILLRQPEHKRQAWEDLKRLFN